MSGFISANLQRRCSSYYLRLSTLFFALLLSTYTLAQYEDGTIEAGMIETGTYQVNAGDVLSLPWPGKSGVMTLCPFSFRMLATEFHCHPPSQAACTNT